MQIKDIKHIDFDLSQRVHSLQITDPNATASDYASLLPKITGLAYLTIQNPRVQELPEDALNNAPELKNLSIECANLKNLPQKWLDLPIRQLMINCPKLTSLPWGIWQIATLQYLQLLNLPLEEIPEFEPQIDRMYSFRLSAPFLRKLPASLKRLDLPQMHLDCPQLLGIGDELNYNEALTSLTMEAPNHGFNGSLYANKNLRNLTINGMSAVNNDILKELPEGLEYLYLSGKLPDWKGALDFSKLKKVKKITLLHYQGTSLPDSIGDCQLLEELQFNKCGINDLPEALLKCQNLKSIWLNDCPLRTIPEVLIKHPSVKQIQIGGAKLNAVPNDWSQAASLEVLNLTRTQLQLSNLNFLETMPKISKLYLYGNIILNPHALMIKKGVQVTYGRPEGVQFKSLDDFRKLCNAITKTDLRQLDKEWFVNYLAARQDIKTIDDLDWYPLLQATNINHSLFRKKVLSLIHKRMDQQSKKDLLNPAAVLYISGKTKLTKTEIKKIAGELNLQVENKLGAQVTHVLIGSNCKDYDQLGKDEFIYLTENHLQDYYSQEKPRFLEQAEQTEEENPLVDNVSALLQSADAANVLLGLEMLKTGGVPKGLVEDLIVIQKTTPDSKVRSTVKKMLELHAPQEWLLVIRDTLSFKNIATKSSESDLRKQLKKLAGRTSNEMAGRLSILFYKHYQRGLRFALLSQAPKAIKEEATQLLFDGTHFDYSKGVGYKNWKNTAPDSVIMYSAMGTNAPLPVKAKVLGKIESLNLHNCKYETIRREIVEFKDDLTKLDLSNNWIKAIPGYFMQMEKLTELDLSFNIFTEFPIKLMKLKKLRRLDLRHNRTRGGFNPLTVPDEFREGLPDCEVLV